MEEGSWQPNSDGIPVDLFVSKTKTKKKRPHITTSAFNLKFTDSSNNLLFSVGRPPRSDLNPHQFKRLLSDSSGTPLIFISHNQKASWEGFSGEGNGNDPMFRVERTTKTLTRVEFQVFLNTQNSEKSDDDDDDFKMRGSPFYRSCTIYKGNSVVAQTSLMYKLGIQIVPRNRFRLTIFPGYADHAFFVALTVIFFYGRKLWI